MLFGISSMPIQAGKKRFRPVRIAKGGIKIALGVPLVYIGSMFGMRYKKEKTGENYQFTKKFDKGVACITAIPGAYLITKGLLDLKKGFGI